MSLNETDFINYYRELDLDRTQTTEELRTEIMALLKDYNSMLSSTEQDKNPELYDELEEKMGYCRQALVIFSAKQSRRKYDKELDEHGESENVHEKYQELFKDVVVYFEDERYELTVELCKKLIELDPNIPDAYSLLSKAYYNIGNYDEAMKILDDASKAFRSNIHIRWSQIRLRILLDDYQIAQQLLNEALEEFPLVYDFNAEQVYLYLKTGNNAIAKKKIEEFLSANPSDIQYRQQVCEDLVRLALLCYHYFPENDDKVLLNKAAYNKCREYLVLANQIFNTEDAKQELDTINYLGQKSWVQDGGTFKGGVLLTAIGCFLLYVVYRGATASGKINIHIGIIICFIIALFPLISGILRLKKMHKPNWEILRDAARGYSDYDRSIWGSII